MVFELHSPKHVCRITTQSSRTMLGFSINILIYNIGVASYVQPLVNSTTKQYQQTCLIPILSPWFAIQVLQVQYSNVVLHYLHIGCLPPNISHGDLFGWKVTKFTQHTWKTKAPAAWWKYEEHHSGGQVIYENDTGFYNINKHMLESFGTKQWLTMTNLDICRIRHIALLPIECLDCLLNFWLERRVNVKAGAGK